MHTVSQSHLIECAASQASSQSLVGEPGTATKWGGQDQVGRRTEAVRWAAVGPVMLAPIGCVGFQLQCVFSLFLWFVAASAGFGAAATCMGCMGWPSMTTPFHRKVFFVTPPVLAGMPLARRFLEAAALALGDLGTVGGGKRN